MSRPVAVLVAVVLLGLAGCVGGPGSEATPTTSSVSAADLSVQPADRYVVTVTHVVDGDTVDVRMPDGSEERVRLVGIDTPEVAAENDPAEYEGVPDTTAGADCLREAGRNASDAVRDRLGGATVTLAVDPRTDRRGGYGRLLAYVVENGTNVNHELVRRGHARVYDTDFSLRAEFDAAERDARTAGRGLWRCQR